MRIRFVIFTSLVFFISCSNKKQQKEYFEYKGFAAGTSFIIEYDKNAGNIDEEVHRILKSVESSVDLTNSSSIINSINRNDSTGVIDEHFKKLLQLSAVVYKETNKAFDPTDMSLNRYWHEDNAKYLNQSKVDSNIIDSILTYVGFDHIFLSDKNVLVKKYDATILDFKNIYRGYMVDLIADLFASYRIDNYRIEIGGRIKAKGINPRGKRWSIGIDEPTNDPKLRKLMAIATLDNRSYATAGTYRKYFEQNGMKMPYTIDPQTGYPVKHTLISVSVFTASCADADAYAAAFMVMGPELTKAFLNTHPSIEAYLISTNYKGEWVTFISDGLREKIEIVKEEVPI